MKRTLFCLVSLVLATLSMAKPITITVLHTDDLHGHIEPFKIKNGTYGGYARQLTLVKRYMASDPNPLLLSGGDTFQGTLYFNVYQGLADLYFMNLMGYNGMAVGNHEFDLGPEPLSRFAKGANFPILSANIDVSQEPLLKDLIKPHTILTVDGEKVGLIGATTPDLPTISSPGDKVKMLELFSSIENSVKALEAEGVNKIFLLSHLGYTLEQEVAAKVRGIDLIVGGHSHTLLGEFNNPDFPPSEGPYPTIVKNPDGNRTLLVAAWEWGKLLGRIKVHFDDNGAIQSWTDAQPIVVDSNVEEDPLGKWAVYAFAKPIENLRNTIIGQTVTGIDGSRETVRKGESPMANVIADSMLESGAKAGAELALINGGGVRSGIDNGPITYEEAIQVQPFNNQLVILDLTGEEILRALEYGVEGIPENRGQFLHVSKGSSYTFDLRRPKGQQVTNVIINGKPLERGKTYRTIMNSFMASGGDDNAIFRDAKGYRLNTGTLDIDVLVEYIRKHTPIIGKPEGRIVAVGR
jgi:5'-nucleotidase / UDP-sugar diphosphatase